MTKTHPLPNLHMLPSPDWLDYELLDTGNGLKLERFGAYTFVRPEFQAMWQPVLPKSLWERADAKFEPAGGETGGRWISSGKMPSSWDIGYKNLRIELRLSASRQLGVFPEQATLWDWIAEQVKQGQKRGKSKDQVRVLNLFGYTGLASLAAAAAGAQVTHIDASKRAVRWARRNQELSGLSDRPIRWLVDDAYKFVNRELRRGSKYDGIILDPPRFGRGPKGQVWELFDLLPELLSKCRQLLNPTPIFIVLTVYAIRSLALSTHYAINEITADLGGKVTSGELVLVEKSAGRALSMAIFSRWSTI